MNQPYRTPGMKRTHNLPPRWKARARGLWRRVVVPTTWVTMLGVILGTGSALTFCAAGDASKDESAKARRHFDDWQRAIDENQRKLDGRQADLERREGEVTLRIKTFEDIVSMSPLFVKDTNNTNPLFETMKRAGVSSTNTNKDRKD